MQDGRLAPVTRIDAVDVENLKGDFRTDLTEHFTVVRGEIVAANPARVSRRSGLVRQTVVLQVQAMSSSDAMHYGRITFRVGQWPLSVRLEAPPSNRALSVSNIEVGISMLGAGIAVQRMTDARGRGSGIASRGHGRLRMCRGIRGQVLLRRRHAGALGAAVDHAGTTQRRRPEKRHAALRVGKPQRRTRSRSPARSRHLRLRSEIARTSWRQRSGSAPSR